MCNLEFEFMQNFSVKNNKGEQTLKKIKRYFGGRGYGGIMVIKRMARKIINCSLFICDTIKLRSFFIKFIKLDKKTSFIFSISYLFLSLV